MRTELSIKLGFETPLGSCALGGGFLSPSFPGSLFSFLFCPFPFLAMASADVEYRCFVGGLAWATDDRSLERAFSAYGEIIESKVSDPSLFFSLFFE